VAEYCQHAFPKFTVRYRCPLGPVPQELVQQHGLEKALRLYRPWRPEADALVVGDRELILIEGKVFKVLDGLAKLPVYRKLIPHTPELAAWRDWPVKMLLLVVRAVEPWVTAAREMGVELVEWAPTWVQQVWARRDRYWTREAVELREKRKEILRRVGFE